MNVGHEISAAWDAIERERLTDHYLEVRRQALRIIQEIPSGTPDEKLTNGQKRAWRDYDGAVEALGILARGDRP